MLSIIICSVSPERLSAIRNNIGRTVGVEYEIIAVDNRERNMPIARVYNEGAVRAAYPYLFFVHEDVVFHTGGWGAFVEERLSKPDCGVIGFAGSTVKLSAYSGWYQFPDCSRSLLFQAGIDDSPRLDAWHVHLDRPFEEVVVVDGLGMFVRKDVWSEYPFDEQMLTGFHCYDLDFSLQIAASGKYRNYVCSSPKVIVEHDSAGSFREDWFNETIRLHRMKWRRFLPVCAEGYPITPKRLRWEDERCFDRFLDEFLKTSSPERWPVLKEFFVAYPFSLKHLSHCLSHLSAYLVRRR